MKIYVEYNNEDFKKFVDEVCNYLQCEAETKKSDRNMVKAGNVQWLGAPAGLESPAFQEILQMIKDNKGKNVDCKARVLVFVTPTCPYCPSMAKLAALYGIGSENIEVTIVNAMEEPQLADLYNVSAVPKTVIESNNKEEILGLVPARIFEQYLNRACQ